MFNRRMLSSMLIIGILACIASAETWAYYEDSQHAKGNNINAGSLDLVLINNIGDSFLIPLTMDKAKPGDNNIKLTESPITAINRGTIDGVLSAKIAPADGTASDLAKYVVISAYVNDPESAVTLWDKGVGNEQIIGNLKKRSSTNVHFIYSFPDNGPQDDAQGDIFEFDVVFTLKQK